MYLNGKVNTYMSNGSISKEIKIPESKSITIYKKEKHYGAHNYSPTPIALSKGKGVYLWDVDGKKYYDFFSACCAVNQGHCHPKIVKTLQKQAETLTLSSRAFFSDALGEYAEYISKVFGYDKVLPINSGAEAGEAACKLARRWGYSKKSIPSDQAKIVFAKGHYWGSTVAAISASTDEQRKKNYGPLMSGFLTIPYNDLEALEKVLKEEPNVCAFMVEPIQHNAGIIVPKPGYLKGVRELCTKYNILWIDDEVHCGLGRTGKLLAVHHEHVKPDMVCLGKALSGGTQAISAVLADDEVMLCVRPGEHGSTFGGSQMSSVMATVALQVILEENLAENATRLGEIMKKELDKLPKDLVIEIRGKGLFQAIVINKGKGFTAADVCNRLQTSGILTKPIHEDVIRLTPPLVITEAQMKDSTTIIFNTINSFRK